MRSNHNSSLFLGPKNDHESRHHGRLRCDGFDCSLGHILDMSASGVRITRKGKFNVKEGESTVVQISASCGTIAIPCVLVWSRKLGFRRYEAGFKFEVLTPQLQPLIASIARAASIRHQRSA